MTYLTPPSPPIPTLIPSCHLRTALETLSYRAARLLRTGAECRGAGTTTPLAALREQRRLNASLTHWTAAFDRFCTSATATVNPSGTWTVDALRLKQLLVAVWVDCALAPDETAYDRHLDAFRTIVRLDTLAPDTDSYDRPRQQRQQKKPRFTFERVCCRC